jgi:hypothetical protein
MPMGEEISNSQVQIWSVYIKYIQTDLYVAANIYI